MLAIGLVLLLPLTSVVAGAAAQSAPPAQPVVPGQPLVEPPPLLAAEPVSAPVAVVAAPSAAAPDVRELTRQLLELEARTAELEQTRAKIRVRGVRIGKIISWTVTALMLTSAFSSFGSAEQIKEAIKDGRDDKIYDKDGDKDVDKDDEQKARRAARALAISSLIPIGLGVWTSIVHRQRLNQQRSLGYQLEDVAVRRRSLLQQMGAAVGVSQQHASLQLSLTF
jgi:hypothetical protein